MDNKVEILIFPVNNPEQIKKAKEKLKTLIDNDYSPVAAEFKMSDSPELIDMYFVLCVFLVKWEEGDDGEYGDISWTKGTEPSSIGDSFTTLQTAFNELLNMPPEERDNLFNEWREKEKAEKIEKQMKKLDNVLSAVVTSYTKYFGK